VGRRDDDEDDDEESKAVDRVLKKYEKAQVMDDDEGRFDARYERSMKEKMDEWKRDYYKVRFSVPLAPVMCADRCWT
jgi:5'-3' exoribonuclease 1